MRAVLCQHGNPNVCNLAGSGRYPKWAFAWVAVAQWAPACLPACQEQDEGMADLAAQIGEAAQRLQLGERWRGRQTSATRVQRQWRGCFARRLRRKLQAQRYLPPY